MLGIKNTYFLGISALLILTGCLPDGTSSTKEKSAEQANIESTHVAASLSNIALQMQTSIVSDDALYAGIKSNSWEINLGTLAFPALGTEKVIFASTDAVAQTKAFLCPLDGTETRFQQITWLDSRNDAGDFSMKGVGENSGPLLTALSAKTSSNSTGLFKNGQVILRNGDILTLPPTCGAAAAIPNNAPVIVYTIDKPVPPAQDITRLEYRTIACTSPSIGEQLQSRKFIIRTDGTNNSTSPEAVWTNVGDGCVLAANISADAMTQTAGQAPQVNIGDLTGDAAAGLRTALVQQLATPCVSSKTTKTTSQPEELETQRYSDMPERISEGHTPAATSENSNVDTCANIDAITVDSRPSETDSGAPRTETMTTACSSAGLSNTDTGSYANFNGSTTFENWLGTIVLDRQVRVSSNQTSIQGDTTGAWRGRSLSCIRFENLSISCDQYYNAALNARNNSANSLDPFASNLPYQFRRTANINGFSNADTLQPNVVTYAPDWTVQSGSCGWTETEVTPAPTNCTYPNQLSEPGTRTRDISVSAEGIASVGAWSPDTAHCVPGIDYASPIIDAGGPPIIVLGWDGQIGVLFNIGGVLVPSANMNPLGVSQLGTFGGGYVSATQTSDIFGPPTSSFYAPPPQTSFSDPFAFTPSFTMW